MHCEGGNPIKYTSMILMEIKHGALFTLDNLFRLFRHIFYRIESCTNKFKGKRDQLLLVCWKAVIKHWRVLIIWRWQKRLDNLQTLLTLEMEKVEDKKDKECLWKKNKRQSQTKHRQRPQQKKEERDSVRQQQSDKDKVNPQTED